MVTLSPGQPLPGYLFPGVKAATRPIMHACILPNLEHGWPRPGLWEGPCARRDSQNVTQRPGNAIYFVVSVVLGCSRDVRNESLLVNDTGRPLAMIEFFWSKF